MHLLESMDDDIFRENYDMLILTDMADNVILNKKYDMYILVDRVDDIIHDDYPYSYDW